MTERRTVFSPDRAYRYTLWREWEGMFPATRPGYVCFIGLNPSTADETINDPTIRRCIGFAQQWGYGALCMANLFAFRATDPREMMGAADPVGPDNNQWLLNCTVEADMIIAVWGVNGAYQNRDRQVKVLLKGGRIHCLGLTQDGFPRHPLYMPSSAKPTIYWSGQ